MSIEDIIQLKQSLYFSLLKLDILIELPFFEEITRQDKSHKCMDFTMSVAENMETQMFGDILLMPLIISHLQLLLMMEFSVFMEDFPLQLINWIRLEI